MLRKSRRKIEQQANKWSNVLLRKWRMKLEDEKVEVESMFLFHHFSLNNFRIGVRGKEK